MCICVYFSESDLAEPGLWHAARPSGYLSVLLRGEDLGRTGGTVSAPHRMEGQSGWPQIHGAAGQLPHNIQFCHKDFCVGGTVYRLNTEMLCKWLEEKTCEYSCTLGPFYSILLSFNLKNTKHKILYF